RDRRRHGASGPRLGAGDLPGVAKTTGIKSVWGCIRARVRDRPSAGWLFDCGRRDGHGLACDFSGQSAGGIAGHRVRPSGAQGNPCAARQQARPGGHGIVDADTDCAGDERTGRRADLFALWSGISARSPVGSCTQAHPWRLRESRWHGTGSHRLSMARLAGVINPGRDRTTLQFPGRHSVSDRIGARAGA
nr:hypothetical protein [Tanacetum cinerariifolium]